MGLFIQGAFAECPCATCARRSCPRGSTSQHSSITRACDTLWVLPGSGRWGPAQAHLVQAGQALRRGLGPRKVLRPWGSLASMTFFSVPGLNQDLEQKLSLQEQDAVIVRSMKSELVRLPKVEQELKQLREENAYLR